MEDAKLTNTEELNLIEAENIDLLEAEEKSTFRAYSMELLILLMLALMAIIYFSQFIMILVPAGFKGAMFRPLSGGTQLNGLYYDEGIHLLFPWNDLILYDTRILEHQDTVLALTRDGLEVTAQISYRYFPDYHRIGQLHRELGPDYLYSILVPQITAITRDVISYYRVDKLYSVSRDSIQLNLTQTAQRQISDHYPISIIDIVIRNIDLPAQVIDAIEKKLVQEQQMLEYDFKIQLEEKEATRKVIVARGIEQARLIEAQGIKTFLDTSQLDILQWEGINATKELAKSPNAKVVIIGTASGDLPVILGGNN